MVCKRSDVLYSETQMASVAKRLRQRIVVPPFVGSSPIVRPDSNQLFLSGSVQAIGVFVQSVGWIAPIPVHCSKPNEVRFAIANHTSLGNLVFLPTPKTLRWGRFRLLCRLSAFSPHPAPLDSPQQEQCLTFLVERPIIRYIFARVGITMRSPIVGSIKNIRAKNYSIHPVATVNRSQTLTGQITVKSVAYEAP